MAASLTEPVEAEVRRWQRAYLAVRPELRISREMHVTLCFLGDIPDERVPEIVGGLGAVAIPPLAVELAEPVFLPQRGRKSVVAIQVADPSGELVRLQDVMSEVLIELGVLARPSRAFLAHVTVARFRRPGKPFSLQNVNVRGFGLPSVILYSSVLEKGGAVHTPLATFPVS